MTALDEMKAAIARKKARELRFKRPALNSLGWEFLSGALDEIIDRCADVRWAEDLAADSFGGDEDDGFGYELAFSELGYDAERLRDALENIRDLDEPWTLFDDCTVALLGNRYECVGYDDIEEDYYSLTAYESELAQRESGKRLMRLTKAEMISTVGQCMGILLSFYDLQQRFDILSAALGVATEQHLEVLQTVRRIDELYERWNADGAHPYDENARQLDRLCRDLPDLYWIA